MILPCRVAGGLLIFLRRNGFQGVSLGDLLSMDEGHDGSIAYSEE